MVGQLAFSSAGVQISFIVGWLWVAVKMADIASVAVSDNSRGPCTMLLDDLLDRLEALFAAQEAKSSSKQEKFTKAVFRRQLPIHLEHEALQVCRKHRSEF
jgi:hypothetical protein